MRYYTIILLFIILTPSTVQADSGVGDCDRVRERDVTAVAGAVAAGKDRAWGSLACGIARANTQPLQFVGQYTGPVFLAAAGATWSVAVPFVGCTVGSFTTANTFVLSGSNSITAATITMTSNECRGAIQVRITLAAADYWFALFDVNIRVEQPNLFFACEATGTSANAYTPTTTCTPRPSPLVNVTTGDLNFSIPTELAIQLCGPNFIDTGICSAVELHGNGEIDQTGNISMLLPILFFALVIIWAEIKKEKELYALAVLTGAFEVLFLWPNLTPQMRTLLIIVTFFLAWRLYSASSEDKNGA